MNSTYISTHPFGEVDPAPLNLLASKKALFQKNELRRKLKPEELAENAKNASYIIAGTENLEPLILSNKNLKLISRVGIGLDSVPLELCKQKGITVCYTPDAVTMAVAELTLGVMLSITRYVGMADRLIREGGWKRFIGKRIEHSTIGIVGFGRVGRNVCRLLSGFRPKSILVYDIKTGLKTELELFGEKYNVDITTADFTSLLGKSDIVSVHVPLYSKTKNMIGVRELNLISDKSFVINQSRGGIVDESALFNALENNEIAGAALDVFENEPYQGPLTQLDNILLTNHMGSCSFDCRKSMELQAAEAVIDFIEGNPLKNEVPESEYIYQF